MICSEIHDGDDNDDYDYEFFNNGFTKYITCKLFPHSSIVELLNNKIYGIVFDENVLKHKYILTDHQKLDLESNLELDLPNYFNILGMRNELSINNYQN